MKEKSSKNILLLMKYNLFNCKIISFRLTKIICMKNVLSWDDKSHIYVLLVVTNNCVLRILNGVFLKIATAF